MSGQYVIMFLPPLFTDHSLNELHPMCNPVLMGNGLYVDAVIIAFVYIVLAK